MLKKKNVTQLCFLGVKIVQNMKRKNFPSGIAVVITFSHSPASWWWRYVERFRYEKEEKAFNYM